MRFAFGKYRRWKIGALIVLIAIAAYDIYDHHRHPVFWGLRFLVRIPHEGRNHPDLLTPALVRLREQGFQTELVLRTNSSHGALGPTPHVFTNFCTYARIWRAGQEPIEIRKDPQFPSTDICVISNALYSVFCFGGCMFGSGYNPESESEAFILTSGEKILGGLPSDFFLKKCGAYPREIRVSSSPDGLFIFHGIGNGAEMFAAICPDELLHRKHYQPLLVDERIYSLFAFRNHSGSVPCGPPEVIFAGLENLREEMILKPLEFLRDFFVRCAEFWRR